MLRTASASLAFGLLGWLSAAWLTQDFQVWTAEGARRLTVIDQPVDAPDATLAGLQMTGQKLPDWLTGPGRVTIVDFIYTRCATVCSALGGEFQQLQRATAADPAVRLLSISFDPAHDGVVQLQQYANRWGADPSGWRVATVPDAAELRRLLDAFQVVVIPDGRGGYEHNAALLIVDGRGRLVRIFDYTQLDAALAYARRVAQREAAG
jgi:protein SCO1/2